MNLTVERAKGDLLGDVRSHCEQYHYLKRLRQKPARTA